MESEKIMKVNMYDNFNKYTITELEELISSAKTREEKFFYNRLLNFKMAIEQEKVIGKDLL